MKSFYIYIAVMAVVMCVYSVVLLTMAKKRKRDVQEWLEQNPKAAKVYIGSTSSNLLSYILTPSSISLIAIDNDCLLYTSPSPRDS